MVVDDDDRDAQYAGCRGNVGEPSGPPGDDLIVL
jgi:hypothetical protein